MTNAHAVIAANAPDLPAARRMAGVVPAAAIASSAAATRPLEIAKLHGLGNDYVFVDGFDVPVADAAALARAVSDRHRSVGGDGLILLLPPRAGGDVRMRMFNADGSEAEMCGNGIRCLVRLAVGLGRADASPLRVETGAGTLACRWTPGADGRTPDEVEVDMGPPTLELDAIPVDASALDPIDGERWGVAIDGRRFEASFCSMGNPHAVIEVPTPADLEAFELARVGPLLERHPAFPARMNVHVVAVHGPGHLAMRTWERGSGITQACGTGACAVLVAMARRDRAAREAAIDLPGGRLSIRHDEATDHVWMTGPAETAFVGTALVPAALLGG